jgi:hypothetical protein
MSDRNPLVIKLKSGEYDGADLMKAWLLIEKLETELAEQQSINEAIVLLNVELREQLAEANEKTQFLTLRHDSDESIIEQFEMEYAALKVQLVEANEKLRWNTWPEHPSTDGNYVFDHDLIPEPEIALFSDGRWLVAEVYRKDYRFYPLPTSEVKG